VVDLLVSAVSEGTDLRHRERVQVGPDTPEQGFDLVDDDPAVCDVEQQPAAVELDAVAGAGAVQRPVVVEVREQVRQAARRAQVTPASVLETTNISALPAERSVLSGSRSPRL
jgi:hypothetical protein